MFYEDSVSIKLEEKGLQLKKELPGLQPFSKPWGY